MFKKLLIALTLCLLPRLVFATQEYDTCYAQAKDDNEVALCMKAESARVLKQLQNTYLEISKHPQTAGWNNGNGLITGNLKDMYDHWLAYRNRYCSLFAKSSENGFGSESFHKERCLLRMTTDQYDLMHQILINANSGAEEDHD